MAFSGIIRPPVLTPVPCGLLSVAQVFTNSDLGNDERWTRGTSFEYNSIPSTLGLLASNGNGVDFPPSPTGNAVFYEKLDPFYIEIKDLSSTLATTPEEVKARSIDQLTAASQKIIEIQLWNGTTSLFLTDPVPHFTSGDQLDIVTLGGKSPADALSLLEGSIAESPTGSQGIIHMTRDVASALGSRLERKRSDSGRPYITTRLGTPVVVGSGYSGNGPQNAPESVATRTNKWMFATGDVQILLGDVEFDSDTSNGSVVIPSVNSIETKALQAAIVAFDPSIFYAAQVSMPDNA